jgi:hypothetical protein
MITYRSLSCTPQQVKSLSGLSVAEFDAGESLRPVQAVGEGVPGPINDLTLLERSGRPERLAPGEVLGGDEVYLGRTAHGGAGGLHSGEEACTGERTPGTDELPPAVWLGTDRRIEHLFPRIGRFGALAKFWRYRRERHGQVFRDAA